VFAVNGSASGGLHAALDLRHEDVARRERLFPGELRLMSNLVAAEAELAGARGR
jgi:hypothetical protein